MDGPERKTASKAQGDDGGMRRRLDAPCNSLEKKSVELRVGEKGRGSSEAECCENRPGRSVKSIARNLFADDGRAPENIEEGSGKGTTSAPGLEEEEASATGAY